MAQKPNQLVDFELLLSSSVAQFVEACALLGDPMTLVAQKVGNAFAKCHEVINFGLFNPEPDRTHEVMDRLFKGVAEIVEMQVTPKEKEFANHFETVKGAIPALGWIVYKPAPTQYIRDMHETSQYYANRVLLQFKGREKNAEHTDWVNKFNKLFTDLRNYVSSNFLTGFTWNLYRADSKNSVTFPPTQPQRFPPTMPPPPPPPPTDGPVAFGDHASGDASRQALLQELNQGTDITRNLKPVRGAPRGVSQLGSTVRTSTAPGVKSPAKAQTAPARPPKFALEGRKWVVEYQKNQPGMRVENEDMGQSVAMFQCENVNLNVANKINSVVIDSCKRSDVTVQAVISSVDLIRCERVRIQCDGNVSLISIDNCDSIQIFLKKAARNVEIISSKSNSCNVCLLEEDGDYKELAMPEQIRTVLAGPKLQSNVIDKY